MPYRPPLVPREFFVADPADLPERRPGEEGLAAIARAELIGAEPDTVSLKAVTADGQVFTAELAIAGAGIVRVRLATDPAARPRSQAAITLVRPKSDPNGWIEITEGRVRLFTGPLIAELWLDPWRLRFLADDGTRLEAWLVPVIDAKRVIAEKEAVIRRKSPAAVLVHDFGATREQMLSLVHPLHDAGFVVLVLSLRGSD